MFDALLECFEREQNHLKSYVVHGGLFYYVSTNRTFDRGWETMIFSCDENNCVTDWAERYAELHDNATVAAERHYAIARTWKP